MPSLIDKLTRRAEPRGAERLVALARARRRPAKRPGPLGWLSSLDQAVLRAMRTRGHTPASETAVKGLGLIGEWAAVWVAIGAGSAALDPKRRRRWLSAAAVGPAAVVANFAVKITVGRARPILEEHPALAKAPTKLSFPSAHSTSSVAAAVALGRVEPAARPPAYALAAAICLSRPYLGMHYPSDVLAGAAFGALLGRLAPGLSEPSVEERMIDLVDRESQAPVAAPSPAGEPA